MHAQASAPCADGRYVAEATASSVVQALQFSMPIQGRPVKVVVLAEVLIKRFGATDAPTSWWGAFESHCDAIVEAALKRYRPGADVMVLDEAYF